MAVKTSSWSTNRKYLWARREAGQLTLVGHRGVFLLLTDKVQPITATSLRDAIAQADRLEPPPEWSYVCGLWLRRGWKVQPVEGGWSIFDEEGAQKSKQVFERADLARKWCEVRADRVGINLRGPKPKTSAVGSEEAAA